MAGNNRIASGKVSQTKSKGAAFLKEYQEAFSPEKLAKEDGKEE